MSYEERLARYEWDKAGIKKEGMNPVEYEKRIREIARKWRI